MDLHTNPPQINSFDVNKVLEANIVYLNRKRKLQVTQSGLPLPKHKCWDRILSTDLADSPPDKQPVANNLKLHVTNVTTVSGPTMDESGLESAEDSNSFDGDMDYTSTTILGEVKMIPEISETTPDRPHRSVSSNIVSNLNHHHNAFGLYECLNFDENLFGEFGDHFNCSSGVEHGNDGTEQCEDKVLEEMLYSNGMPLNHALSSSGKWSVYQENQGGTKNLTIDKEFEEYFSMLML